ncbi:MAG: cob(I)yrinic acid a,c-diamide adenosyltransferase [Anaerohalosphaeraceae bacterium]|nr:cob(I)yrinic acid a,c-diamide adenosyltransferase [Anaerohalosphaeraceae bacterium]
MFEKGLVQIYTGNGKGKTTAALGLALRAAGAGMKIAIFQFLKPASMETSERTAASQYNLPITFEALDCQWNMAKSFDEPATVANTKEEIEKLCEKIAGLAAKKTYDVIILDEINFCLSKGLAKIGAVKNIIDKKETCVEIILTGRGAGDELMKLADLVTEMKEIKHPFDKGITARKGIEF